MKLTTANILIVDDEHGMREGMRRILTAQGHTVETAENGTEGIEKGTAREYDLYFLDLKMPDIEGAEVLAAIKAKYPESICVIMTAFASIDTAVETTQLGAYNYMAKPFTPDELQQVANRAFERRWYILEARRLRVEEERRLLEIAHEKSRIHTIMQAIDDGILVLNQDAEVALVNPRFAGLLDVKAQITIGQPILGLLPDSLSAQLSELLQNHKKFTAIKQEIIIRPPAELVVMVNTAPILDHNNRLIGLVSVARDISELKQLELLKSQFVNMVAHELRAPLGAIEGYLEMVVNKTLGDEPETYDKYLARSLERSEALLELINDLLNISRIEAGKIRREIEKFNFSQLLEQTIEFFQPDLLRKNIRADKNIAPDLFIEADQEEIRRMISNLTSNAIKYNKEDGEIFVNCQREDHQLHLEIRDTGIGMTPEESGRLFEEFFRAKNVYTRKITGTGLGLSLVKKIVDSYAGHISVQSEFKAGTVFHVFLPLAAQQQANQ